MNQLLLKILDPNLGRALPGFRKKNHINRYLDRKTLDREQAANEQNRQIVFQFVPGFKSAYQSGNLEKARQILIDHVYPENKKDRYQIFLSYFGRTAVSVKRRPFYFGSPQVLLAKAFPELLNYFFFSRVHEGHSAPLPKMAKNMISGTKNRVHLDKAYLTYVTSEIDRLEIDSKRKNVLKTVLERHATSVLETRIERENDPQRYASRADKLVKVQVAAKKRLDKFFEEKLALSADEVAKQSNVISKTYINWILTFITDDASMRIACGGSILNKIYYLEPRQNYQKFSINWQDALVKLFPTQFSSKEDLVNRLNRSHPDRKFYVLQKRAA